MKSSNKWLLGFGTALGVLVILAVVLVLTMPGSDEVELLPEDTPGGVVQRYIYAINDGNFEEAYSYLSPSALEDDLRNGTYEDWSGMYMYREWADAWRAIIDEPEILGEKATVNVRIEVFKPDGVFRDPVDTRYYYFTLENQEGAWKITSPLYIGIY
ncbi:MAG: hypothetical protein JSU79_08990 [Dehalococcoidales bacterium]|nr:MAG: hypothetical protein JSU79_08990 [Dehalococcoidales bacterium]